MLRSAQERRTMLRFAQTGTRCPRKVMEKLSDLGHCCPREVMENSLDEDMRASGPIPGRSPEHVHNSKFLQFVSKMSRGEVTIEDNKFKPDAFSAHQQNISNSIVEAHHGLTS